MAKLGNLVRGGEDEGGVVDASPGFLSLLAVRLTRVLVQSGRDVALALSKTPLLAATKG